MVTPQIVYFPVTVLMTGRSVIWTKEHVNQDAKMGHLQVMLGKVQDAGWVGQANKERSNGAS